MKRITVALATIAFSILAGTQAGHADEICDTVIYDSAGVLGARTNEVAQAAERLSNLGAEVRVRTLFSFGSEKTFADIQKKLEARCSSWRRSDSNDRRINLVTVVLIPNPFADKQFGSAVFYGKDWKSALDRNWDPVRREIMHPHFESHDWAGGIVSGLDEISQRIRTHLNFPASNKEAPSVSSQKSPASNMSIPTVLVGAVALILTIALTVLFLGHISDVIRCKNKIKQAEIVLGQAEEEMHTASQHGFRLDKAAGPLRDICSEVTLAKTYLAQKNYRSAEMLA